MRVLYIGIALFLLLTPALAQQATMLDVFSGKLAPLSVAVKTLGPEWLSIEMKTAGAMPDWFTTMVTREGGPDLRAFQPTYYTKGQTVSISGETYLITYELPGLKLDPQALQAGIMPERLTPESSLKLSLIHLRTAGSLLNLHPFDLKKELARMDEQNTVLQRAQLKAKQTASMNNLRQLITAAQMYCQDHEELMPEAATVWQDLQIAKQAMVNPVSNERYTYNAALSGKSLGEIEDLASMAAFYEENPPWGDGSRLVAFLDGHVEVVSAELWPEVKKQSGIK